MALTAKQVQQVHNAFQSILRTDYISLEDFEQLKSLEKYYVDFYNNISGLLQKQDNFVIGRRGSGKTSLLYRGYVECLKTISTKFDDTEKLFFNEEKILPVFIDLSKCREIFEKDISDDYIEIHFVRQIIDTLRRQIDSFFDEKFLLVFKKENPALNDLEVIEKLLVEGLTLSSKVLKKSEKDKQAQAGKATAKLSIKSASVDSELKVSEETETTKETSEIRGLNAQDFLNKINSIRNKARIDNIYVFVDEFSDLSPEEQGKFSVLLKKLLGSKINMFFKIGVITDRFNFGDKIIIGRDLFPIPLDLNEFVQRFDGVVSAMKKMEEFMELVINKRLEIYAPGINFSEIFKISKKDLVHRLARQALGVPRTIGLILQQAFTQSQSSIGLDQRIGIQEVNFGMRSVRRTYERQFSGGVQKNLIPSFYSRMWQDILNKALDEKAKNSERPASHILIDPIRKDYLNVFCENFMLHFLEEDRASKYGGNYNLYSIDYAICLENNIKYAETKDEFSAIRFIYDSVLNEYDAYLMNDRSKSYKCPKCKKIYEEEDLAKIKIKRCFEDDTVLEEIIHKEKPRTQGNYTEIEIRILGLISALNKTEAMSAQEIADAVGCSWQKVSNWGTKVLLKNSMINVTTKKGKYFYYCENEKGTSKPKRKKKVLKE